MVPLLADYVLFHYGWQHVCGLFSFFCFLSTLFGLFLEPPNCVKRFFEITDEKSDEKEYQLKAQNEEEIRSLVVEGLENHTDIIKMKHKETPILMLDDKQFKELDKSEGINIMYSKQRKNGLKKNKSESCLNGFENCVTPYKKLRKIVEHDLEASNNGKIESYNYSVVSCIDILLNLDRKEKLLIDGIKVRKMSCFSLQHHNDGSFHQPLTEYSENCDDLKCDINFKKCGKDVKHTGVSKNNNISNEATKTVDNQSNTNHVNSILQRLKLFQDINFVLFCVSNVMLFMALNIPFAYGPDMMVKRNIVTQDNGSNFNMAIGFTSLISMPLVGILVDYGPKLNPFVVTFLSMLSAGISMFIFPMTWSLDEAIIVAIWFGVSFSAFLSLPPVILENILGKENVASAYGLLVFIRGISISVGPPLAGLIYDITKTYNGSFFFAGILFSLAGLPIFIIYILHKRRSGV